MQQKAYGVGELMEVAAARAVPVVAGIGDAALTAPTPCADYDVKSLVNHLFQVVVEFQKLAVKKDSDFTGTVDRVGEGGDWRERFAVEARALVAAWSAPGAEEGTSGSMNMPAPLVGSMALLDLTVHAWDLARATGQPYEAPPEVVGRLSEAVAELAPTAKAMGVFGEPVVAGPDASPFERLLAATGRDPRRA
ncbi:TIGR03086 family metal-binding protein [Streptomyces kunmingensis]|uniref:TIGR03086 family metal-binding protein n=1 Tax=Streptomyces kunmingensis TaxID=68225 RepID=A0ABU6CRX0_9ACTN|nr:TIGR03086 family metal-binding protein [Streptomyces kunmingensis]MEB3966695.1 TIGR03086 family metal-binding protein [Streptomyces kunmingensis]